MKLLNFPKKIYHNIVGYKLTNDIQKYSSLFYADINQKEPSAWMNRLGMFTLLWLKENGFISAQTFKQLEFASENSRAYVLSATISDFIQSLQQQRHSYLDVKPKTPVSLALSGLGLYALSFVLTGGDAEVTRQMWRDTTEEPYLITPDLARKSIGERPELKKQ